MKYPVFAVLSIILAGGVGSAQAQTDAPVAGKDYIEIEGGSPLEPADGKVVVEEFFNYICPACNSFEPQFAAWQAQLPTYAKVVHIPASFRADFVPYARAFYAAQTFGLVDKTHKAVYDAIHRLHTLPGEGEKADEKKIAAFYAEYGVDADEFLSAMNSFGVDLKIRQATQHMQRCKITGTPSIVINGRYLVRGATYADMLSTANFLIEKEHAG
jgi:protein dithiol oxidoreductase (disulfide-forming)